jgi:Propionyl-coenzyme A carboxylase BT domain
MAALALSDDAPSRGSLRAAHRKCKGTIYRADGSPPAIVCGPAELTVPIRYREGGGRGGHEAKEIVVRSTWVPGAPVWHGIVGESEVAVQVRPVPNGFDLAWHGTQARAYV